MQKVKIVSPIYFDGVLFPAGTIVDPTLIPLSAEALIERSWAVPYDGDQPAVASLDVLRDSMPQPEPQSEPQPEPIAKPNSEPEPVSPPAVEPKRKRKS